MTRNENSREFFVTETHYLALRSLAHTIGFGLKMASRIDFRASVRAGRLKNFAMKESIFLGTFGAENKKTKTFPSLYR